MSLNFKNGEAIAIIQSSKNKKLDKKIIKLSANEENEGVKEIKIDDGVIQVLPSIDMTERYYISGPSGSGKSYFISKWLEMNKKIFKGKNKKELYIFSRINEDKQLDKFKPIRVILELLPDNPLTAEDLENSICIFDDIDSIKDKIVKRIVFDLRDDFLVCGRHFNITVICTTHQLMNNVESKRPINESTSCVIYPKSGATFQIKNFLKFYCGFDKMMIDKIMKLKSRWVCIRKTYPMTIIYEKGLFLANMYND